MINMVSPSYLIGNMLENIACVATLNQGSPPVQGQDLDLRSEAQGSASNLGSQDSSFMEDWDDA